MAGVEGARTEGQRQLRALTHTAREVGDAIGASRQNVAHWRAGTKEPSQEMRAGLEREFGIPAAAWERAPVDRPARPREVVPTQPVTASPQVAKVRPSTLEEVTQLLEELDHDAGADGIMPSELVRIRDAKVKALSLKARIEAAFALFEAAAVTKHPAWRRIRSIVLDELRPHPELARRIAERLVEADT